MPVSVLVRLRHGRYDAGGSRPGAEEWPPHPARVFCALAASAQDTEDWDALRWLEGAGVPEVWAGDASEPVHAEAYVVTNQTSAKGGSQTWPGRTSGLRSRASITPITDEFAVVWPEAAPTPDLISRLGRLARQVPYVGRSTSQAEVTVHPCLPEERPQWSRWKPSIIGTADIRDLRIPYPGYVDALQEVYDVGGRSWTVARAIPYVLDVEPEAPVEPALSPWEDLMVWGLARPTTRISGDQVVALTSTLRKAVIKLIGTDVPAQVSGHGADDRAHVAFLGLPDVGHPHADGHLLGVALAVPRGMPPVDWKRLVSGVLGHEPLQWLGVWPGRQVALQYGVDPRRKALIPDNWCAFGEGAREWVTATPMVADGMLRRKRTVEDLVVKSLARVGCPAVKDIDVSPAPLIEGAVGRPRRGTIPAGRPTWPMVHVRVEFDRPYVGPLIAGSLRYLGVGLFVPLRGER